MSQPRHPNHPQRPRRAPAFGDLQASELFCPRCQASRPVRERLLLVLPDGELLEYRCAACGTSLGTRKVTARPPGRLSLP
ncbi:MAG TPA: cytoplasmic protein [bacterium]